MKNLVLRTVTGILFIVAVIGSLLLSDTVPAFFYMLFLLFTVVGSFELTRMAENIGLEPSMAFAVLLSASVFSIPIFLSFGIGVLMAAMLFIPLLFVVLLVTELFRNSKSALANIAVSCVPMLWVGFPFCLVAIWLMLGEAKLALALFVIIWLGDTLAYCAGRLFGKHKLFERISPKKTIEGFVISMVLTTAIATSFYWIPFFQVDDFTTPWHWIAFALIVFIVGTLGDLVESMFKRNCDVKDSGKMLPGHGGVLDRFDSALLAIPVAFIYWVVVTSLF